MAPQTPSPWTVNVSFDLRHFALVLMIGLLAGAPVFMTDGSGLEHYRKNLLLVFEFACSMIGLAVMFAYAFYGMFAQLRASALEAASSHGSEAVRGRDPIPVLQAAQPNPPTPKAMGTQEVEAA